MRRTITGTSVRPRGYSSRVSLFCKADELRFPVWLRPRYMLVLLGLARHVRVHSPSTLMRIDTRESSARPVLPPEAVRPGCLYLAFVSPSCCCAVGHSSRVIAQGASPKRTCRHLFPLPSRSNISHSSRLAWAFSCDVRRTFLTAQHACIIFPCWNSL